MKVALPSLLWACGVIAITAQEGSYANVLCCLVSDNRSYENGGRTEITLLNWS